MVNVYISTKPFVLIDGRNMLENTKEKGCLFLRNPRKGWEILNYGIS